VGIESENLRTQRAQRTAAEGAEKSGSFASLRMTTFLGSSGFEIRLAGRSVRNGREEFAKDAKGIGRKHPHPPAKSAGRVGHPADAAG
jgi:hypothetical protein